MDLNLTLTETPKIHRIKKLKNSDSITPLKIDDINALVLLSRKYFPRSRDTSIDTLKKRTTDLYFKNGKLLPNVSPIVSRSENGDVTGFLGVITKQFQYGDRNVTVANCHHLMATEQARKQLMPIRLLQDFLSGPQDIFFSDNSVDSTRLLWKRLGGEPVIGESIYYKIPLRPVSFTASYALKQYQNRIGNGVRSLASFTDTVAGKMRIPFFYKKKSENRFVPLSTVVMSVLLKKMKYFYHLFPHYDQSDIKRLFRLLEGETRYGTLHKAALMDKNNQPFGWFIYYARNGGICEVIQAVSIPGKETELFNSLTWHAYSKGGVELSGRLMPSQLQTPFATKSVTLPGRMWTLMKSDDIELKHIIQSGSAFITRLEGDLWVL